MPDGKYHCAILQICGTPREKTGPKPRLALLQVARVTIKQFALVIYAEQRARFLIRADKKQFTPTKPNSQQYKRSLAIIWNLRESKLYVFMIKMLDNRQCR